MATRFYGGLRSVEVLAGTDGLARLCITPRDGRNLSSLVGERAREARWEVDELRVERGRLDDVFRELTLPSENHRETAQ